MFEDLSENNAFSTIVLVKQFIPPILFSIGLVLIYLVGYSEFSMPSVTKTNEHTKKEFVVADIAGAVNSSGVYMLDQNSVIADLIDIAGGITNDTSAYWVSKNLTLSKEVKNGDKVYIPYEFELSDSVTRQVDEEFFSDSIAIDESGVQKEDNESLYQETTSTNINTMSKDQLLELQGIGEVYAAKILESRPFTSREDLIAKGSLPASTVDKFIGDITFE